MHETVSPMTNRFLSMTGSQMLGFGHRQHSQLFLAIAGLVVKFSSAMASAEIRTSLLTASALRTC